MKLRTKSFFYSLLVPIVIFIAVMIFTYKQISKYKIQDMIATQLAVLHATTSDIDAKLKESSILLEVGSRSASIRRQINNMPTDYIREELEKNDLYNKAQEALANLRGDNKSISLLYLASETSPHLIAHRWADLPDGYDARSRSWYTGTKKTGKLFITPPYIDAEASSKGALVITMGYPVKTGNNFDGVIAMDFSINDITEIISQVQNIHPELSLTLINGENEQVLYSKTAKFEDNLFLNDLLLKLNYTETEKKDFIYLFKKIHNNGGMEIFDAHRVVQLRKINDTPWILAVSFNKNELLSDNLKEARNSFLIAGILFLIALAVGFIISQFSIFKPIKQLTDKFYNISHGEGDLTVQVIYKNKDELGELAGNFNSFIEKLRQIMISIKDNSVSIEDKQRNVTNTTQETASASIEIQSNVNSINNQIEDLNGQLQSISTAMDEINATVNSLFENTEIQTRAVDDATSSIEEMVAQLESVARIVNEKKKEAEKLTIIINDSGQQISDASQANEEVVELAGKVSEMSVVISGIASQTNLLSMNAAIEAAHAGDAGKGFAVVADEIRKLAEVAQDSSAEIQETINNILHKVDIAYKISKESEDTFSKLRDGTQSTIIALEEINVSTQELSQGGALIIKANEELSQVSMHVKDSAMEMGNTVNSVTEATRIAADISANVKEGMAEIAHGTSDITESVNNINDFSENVLTTSTQLKSETDKFKT